MRLKRLAWRLCLERGFGFVVGSIKRPKGALRVLQYTLRTTLTFNIGSLNYYDIYQVHFSLVFYYCSKNVELLLQPNSYCYYREVIHVPSERSKETVCVKRRRINNAPRLEKLRALVCFYRPF